MSLDEYKLKDNTILGLVFYSKYEFDYKFTASMFEELMKISDSINPLMYNFIEFRTLKFYIFPTIIILSTIQSI